MKTKFTCTFLLLFLCGLLNAQSTFMTIDSLNINNLTASTLVHGDMWWNPDSTSYRPVCRIHEDTSYNIGFTSALWMSGYDGGGKLHVSAQTYRQTGNDYWPGPLDASHL